MGKLKHIKVENLFLILFIPLSIMMMTVMPVMRTPDEYAHLRHAYIIASGQAVTAITEKQAIVPEEPVEIDDTRYTTLRQVMEISGKTITSTQVPEDIDTYENTAIYPPLSYLPQVIGMKAAMAVTDKLIPVWYAARIGNLICTIALLYWAIKRIPNGKALFLILTLMPLNLQQSISASADGIATAIVFAETAFILHCSAFKPVFHLKEYLILAGFALGLICWKVFYLPMVFLFFMIPQECFGESVRKKMAILGAYFIGAIAVLSIWALVCYISMFKGEVGNLTGQTMSGLARFMDHPGDFVNKLIHYLLADWKNLFARLFGYGKAFSWYNVSVSWILPIISVLIIFAVWGLDQPMKLGCRNRVLLLGFSLLCVIVLLFALYAWWTPADSIKIRGFQPRYLLPVILPVMLALQIPHKKQYGGLMRIMASVMALLDVAFMYQILLQTL